MPVHRGGLFDGQDVGKAGHIEDFRDGVIHMANNHAALPVHDLLRRQQHAQACGGQIIKRCKVQHEMLNAGKASLELGFQLRGGRGVKTAGKDEGKIGGI